MLLIVAMIPANRRALALEKPGQQSKTRTLLTAEMLFLALAGDVLNHFHECHDQHKMKTTDRIKSVLNAKGQF